MSNVARPRGPLPPRVYWIRRSLVFGAALLLVIVIANVLGGGSDGKESDAKAEVVSGTPQPDVTPDTGKKNAGKANQTGKKHDGKKKKKKKQLAQPSGPCEDSDVVVTPDTTEARAGGTVPITLLVTTKESEACTFEVSPGSVVIKLTSGDDRIWSSQECPVAVPTRTVIARKTHAGKAVVRWNGQRSNDACSRTAPWALPGYYHAEAAALGGDATDVQFRLYSPERPTITPKPKIKKPKKSERG